jgi:molybdopterin molybdotransferase
MVVRQFISKSLNQMTDITQTKDMLGRSILCTVAQAQQILENQLAEISIQTEELPLSEAFDRVLAEPVFSSEDLPAHPRSTMDGFAVRAGDTFGASEAMPCYLNITGEVLMGKAPAGEVKKGCCHKIPTGGLCPAGADSVVMLEHTVPVDDTMLEVVKSVGTGTNLVQKGEDIATGSQALPQGRRLRPQDIGMLAAIGAKTVKVTQKIRVGILSTGDEIIDHRDQPAPGQIRNINTLTLSGLVRQAGGVFVDYGIVSDKKEIFLSAVKEAIAENDIVLFSGGSSVGVRDLGEQIIEELGPPGILVHGVKLKPGKPVIIGMSGTTPIFGLPGHPVSAVVCFDFFIKPAIERLSGLIPENEFSVHTVEAKLSRNINSAAGRLDVIRVKLKRKDSLVTADPVMGKSGSISTLSKADGFFLIDEDSQGVSENSIVKVTLYK